MKLKVLWAAVAALALLSAGQAYYIFTRPAAAQSTAQTAAGEDTPAAAPKAEAAEPQAPDPWKELEEWRRSVHERLRQGQPPGHGDFDAFFDDGFFSRRFSAFDQMERIHQQMMQALRGTQRGVFDDSWDDWFSERMGMSDFKTTVTRTDKEVALKIEVPGLEGKKADIDVNKDRVRLSFSVQSSKAEKKDGADYRSESVRSFTKILPVPQDADGEKAKVAVEGDAVRITFPRLADKRGTN